MKARKHVHFVGIGGIGMSGIAKIVLRSGHAVSGSDLKENQETRNLREMGAVIFIGHRAEQIEGADVVVYSSAVSPENPELLEAHGRHMPILVRAEMLAELMRKKDTIVVAGAHGKTTTSAMITTVLLEAGFDPTAVIGGRLRSIASNAKVGTDEWFVCESDESDGSFLKLLPTLAVVTNIDREHLNHYGTFERLQAAFVDFSNRVPFDGLVVICRDDPYAAELVANVRRPVMTYGIDLPANVRGLRVEAAGEGMRFDLELDGTKLAEIQLPILGKHNVLNALAASAVALQLGVSAANIAAGLGRFSGIERRLEKKGEAAGICVLDDYAHHPTEIRASIEALRCGMSHGALRVLFQPHRFSRVRDLWDDFLGAFSGADQLVVTPIYAASESPITGIDSERLVEALRRRGLKGVEYAKTLEEAAQTIAKAGRPGDRVVTMGAGDVTRAASLLMGIFEKAQSKEVGG
ncbi:MAG: UDP-N-acetylmuramate--L-alanine ligase [Pseudomonadota bacterium]